MALNNLGLGIVFTASDLASNVIKKVAGNFLGLDNTASAAVENMAKKIGVSSGVITSALKGVTAGLVVAAAGAAGLSTAFGLAKGAAKFEQGLAAVGAISRASTEELGLLEQAALQAGIATQFSPEQAVEGLQSLASAGQGAQEATSTLIPVLDLAAASMGQVGVAGSAEALIGTLNAYGKEADEAAAVTDKLARITQLSNFQARDFASGLSKAAVAGATFNQSLDDTLVAMGLMRNANIDASSASTAFRESTRKLGSDLRAQTAVTKFGVDVFDRQTGRMRSLIDIVGDFQNATKNLGDEQKLQAINQAFGARGMLLFRGVSAATFKTMKDGQRVTLKGTEAIAALRKEMAASAGTASNFREAFADNFGGQLTLLEGSLKTFAIQVGKPFAQVFKPIVLTIVDGLNLVLQTVSALPAGVKKALAGFFVAGSISAIIVGIGVAIAALLPLIKVAGATMLAAFGVAIIPALKVIAVIGLLVAAGFALKRAWEANFGGIRDFLLPVFNKISLAVRSLFGLFKDGEISGALAEDLLRAENDGVLAFVQAVSSAVATIKAIAVGVFEGFTTGLTAIGDVVKPAMEEIMSAFTELGEVVGLIIDPIADALGFSQPGDTFISVIKGISKWLIRGMLFPIEIIVKSVTTLVRIFTFLFRGVTLAFGAIIRLAQGVFNWISDKLTVAVKFYTEVWDGVVDKFKMVARVMRIVFAPVIEWLTKAWVGLASMVISVWTTVGSFVGAIISKIQSVFRSVFNGLADLINKSITAAQKAAFALAPSASSANAAVLKLEKAKLSKIPEPGEETKISVAKPNLGALGKDTGGSGAAGGGTVPGTPGGGTQAPTTPQAQPPAVGGRALSNQDIALLVAAIERSRSAPVNVTVRSRLEVDGDRVAEAVQAAEEDSANNSGRMRPAIGSGR